MTHEAPCGCRVEQFTVSGLLAGPILYCPVHLAAPHLLAALEEIAKGMGAFDRDPLKHATNVIEEAKETARAAILLTQEAK